MKHLLISFVVAVLLGSVVLIAMAEPSPVTLYPVIDPAAVSSLPEHYGTPLDQHRIELKWRPSDDSTLRGYRIVYWLGSDSRPADAFSLEVQGAGISSAIVSGLNLATAYSFQIEMIDQAGRIGSGSNIVIGTTLANGYPMVDDMESGLAKWDLVTTSWDTTGVWSHSPTHSWTDSPDSNYTNLSDRLLVTAVNLMTALKPVLTYWQSYNIMTDGDLGFVEVSRDGGQNWERVYFVTGSSGGWVRESIDLTPYVGNLNVKIRWRLVTNSSGVSDGWYVDDVSIAETPYAVHTLPFYDNVNDAAHSDSLWFSSSWSRLPGGVGAGHYYRDSPYGDFPEYVSTSLTSSQSIDLGTVAAPWLVFSHRLGLVFQSSARIEVSVDGGVNWQVIRTWDGPLMISAWKQEAIDLTEFAGGEIRLRFHLLNLGVQTADGWDLDRIHVGDVPEDLSLVLAANNRDSARLEWTQYAGSGFGHYEVYRGHTPDFLLDKTLVATINEVGTTSFVDPVAQDSTYYYQVFVTNGEDAFISRSNTAFRPAWTLPLLAYPFIDDMETGEGNFLADQPWAITTETAHSGSQSWSDSPGGNYGNNVSVGLALQVDLAGGNAVKPELSFWQQYGIVTSDDWGYVQFSTDGGASYSTVYHLTGSSGGWKEEKIDLTPWRGYTLRIKFILSTNASSQADGWHIDDIRVGETQTAPMSYPLVETMDDSTATHERWQSGSWSWTFPSDDGTHYWSNRSPGIPNLSGVVQYFTMGNVVSLASSNHPQLRFRYRAYNQGSYSWVQISQNDGANYTSLLSLPNASSWTSVQLDLSGYVGGGPIRLGFGTYDNAYGGYEAPWLDIEDFSLSDQPADEVLAMTENQPYAATLCWTRSEEPDFARYEIKRSSSPGVTIGSTTVATVTSAGDTCWVQTGLTPSTVYYYKVFVYDTVGVYSAGSNEVQRPRYDVPLVSYPFSDDMESGSANFLADQPWAITTETAHSGSHSWSDSPGGNYGNNVSVGLALQVDLAGGNAVKPELSFWQQYGIVTSDDWGYVQFSTDGGASYSTVYHLTGSSGGWKEEKIDLTPWRGYTLRIKFILSTNASSQADGWHIDDIRVGETQTAPMSYPLVETMDDSTATHERWQSGSWSWTFPSDDGTHYWSNRSPGIPNLSGVVQYFTMGNVVSLASSNHPQLRFRYRAYNQGSYSWVQISQNDGANYTSLLSLPNASSWTSVQLDLSGYVGGGPIRLGFGTYDNAYGGYEAPWLDIEDFSLSDQPADEVLAMTENQPYAATLCWTRSEEPDFARYEIKRSSSPGVTIGSTTVATVTSAGDTCWVQTGLTPSTVYYYKVFVYDTVGVYSAGSNEVQRPRYDVPLVSYPFSDDMESGSANFLADQPWAITTETAHSGSHSWSDSPGGNYGNNVSVGLALQVDLAGGNAVKPELSFWQQYGIVTSDDWGYVQFSTDGGASYSTVYHLTGSSGGWKEEKIDLTPWRGYTLRIKFILSTNASSQADGWHIDDIRVGETQTAPMSYPLVETMDDSTATHERWQSGSWSWTFPSDDGTHYWSNRSPGIPNLSGVVQYFTMGNVVSLASSNHPQLRFRYRAYNQGSYSWVQISQNDGANYTSLLSLPNASSWTSVQLDLSGYVGGGPIRLGFGTYDNAYGGYEAPWLDIEDFSLSDQPADEVLAMTENQPYAATLCWTRSEEPDFARYEIKRSSSPGVTIGSTTVATVTSAGDTCWVQTGLTPSTVYYYKVFVYDTVGVYSAGSNEVQRPRYDVPLVSYPFSDDMESGNGNFLADQPWAITTETAHSGSHSWSDSPGGNYGNNVSVGLALQVDLAGGNAVKPELSFWQQYGIVTSDDWGYVQFSTDNGASYFTAYHLTGSSGGWKEEKIDLTPWRGYTLRIKFILSTNASSQADGWHIDDVRVGETQTASISYPLVDTVQDSTATHQLWQSGSWTWTSSAGGGTHYWSNRSPGIPNLSGVVQYFTMGNVVSLASSNHPQLRFRYRAYNNGSYSWVQISQNDGANYTSLLTLPNASSWTSVQLDLSGYVGGSPIRLGFGTYDDAYAGYEAPWLELTYIALTEDPALTPQVNSCQLDGPTPIWLTVGQASPPISARVYEPGVTNGQGQGPGIVAQIGIGPHATYPSEPTAGWSWATATYGGDAAHDSMDVYTGTISGGAIGDYDFAYRFSMNGGSYWIYADLDGNTIGTPGGFNYYDLAQAGELIVTLEPELTMSANAIELTLPMGQTASRNITLGNDGIGPLIFVADEGVNPPVPSTVTWMDVVPQTATIEPNEILNLGVSIDATYLQENEMYQAYVMLRTNDPDQTEVDIPVIVHVVPPSAPHVSGTVLNVEHQATEQAAFVEVYDGTTMIASTTTDASGAYRIFGVPTGTHVVRAYSEGYYPIETTVQIPIDGLNLTLHHVPAMTPTNTSVNFYGANSIFNSLPLRTGDVVTVQDGDEIFCGIYFAQIPGHYGFLHVYGDDSTTPDIDEGASPGDTLTFRINWQLALTTGPDLPLWMADGDVRHVELDGLSSRDALLRIETGWNLVSFNKTPDADSTRQVLAHLIAGGNLIVASSFDAEWGGARTYDPLLPQFSDLLRMDPMHGYWIKVQHTDSLVVTGETFWTDIPLPLEQNWNLTSYSPEEPREVARALSSIDGQYSQVSGFHLGALTYIPGGQFNTLNQLENTLGYWVKMTSPGVLTYDVPSGGFAFEEPPVVPDIASKSRGRSITPTPWWDSFYGAVADSGNPLPAGSVIQAMDPDGIVCGEFTVQQPGFYGFMPVYGDDPYTPDIDEGAVAGDRIYFKWNGEYLDPQPASFVWQGVQALIRIDLTSPASGIDSGDSPPLVYRLHDVYPNPSHGPVDLRFDLPMATRVQLRICDVSGRIVRSVVDGMVEPGTRSARWFLDDGQGVPLPSGVYFYLFRTDQYQARKKLVILR